MPPEEINVTLEELLTCTGHWPEQVLMDVGGALLDGRSVDVDETATEYDASVRIHFQPLDVTSCGFRFCANPRRITVGEVAEYAKSSCKTCKGLGKWGVRRKIEAGKDERGRKVMRDIEYEQSCSCADRAYKDTHKHFVVDSNLGEWVQLDDLRIDHVDPEDPSTTVREGPENNDPPAPNEKVDQASE